jgi:hypothetical protein
MIPTKARLLDAVMRAIRTFVQTMAAALVANQTGTIDVAWAKAATVSAGAAAISVLWRLVLDPSPVPSLPTSDTGI